jgi:probable HAF family extracellular repeat protein
MNLRVADRFVRPFSKGADMITKLSCSLPQLVSTAGIVAAMLLGGAVSTACAAASLTPLGGLYGGIFSEANGVSADGSVVVGRSDSASGQEAFRWTAGGGMVGLGDLPGGAFGSVANGVSGDGAVVVGYGNSASGNEAFRWSALGGMVGLGDLPDGLFDSYASGASGDGAVIVGYGNSASGYEAFRWTVAGGMVGLGDLPGGNFYSGASGVSSDGAVVVGYSSAASGREAFRWTAGGGMIGLGKLPGGFNSFATGVSGDGAVVVGYGNSTSGQEAFLWTAGGGMQRLWDVLLAQGVNPAADGWTSLAAANSVSFDGNTIVGYGTHNGHSEAFLAVVPEPAGLTLLAASGALAVRRRRGD